MSECDHVVGLVDHGDGGGYELLRLSLELDPDVAFDFCPDCGAPLCGEWGAIPKVVEIDLFHYRPIGKEDAMGICEIDYEGFMFRIGSVVGLSPDESKGVYEFFSLPIRGPGE